MSGFELNFLETRFNKDKIKIKYLIYKDSEWYLELKKKYSELVFKREGNKVYYWNKDHIHQDEIEGSELEEITYNNNPAIFCRIIESFLVYKLSLIDGFKLWLDKYSNCWNVQKEKNLYNSDCLGIFRTIIFNTYFSSFNANKVFGIVVNTKLKTRFLKGKKELENSGFDTRGLAGNGEIIFANKKALSRYLDSTQTTETYNNFLLKQSNNIVEYQEINKFISWIQKVLLDKNLIDGLKIVYCKLNAIPNENEVFNLNPINKPTRYYSDDTFVPYGERLQYNEALQKYKPYNLANLKDNYNIVVIGPIENQGTIEDFVKKIEKKLNNVFHIKNIIFNFRYAKSHDIRDYEDAIYSGSFENIDLALIVVLDKFKTLTGEDSPYLFTKAKFLNREIPTQEVRLETMLVKQSALDYTLNNISLNIFAKLGGIPWVVEKTDHSRQEFIIGISSTINKDKKQIFGVATVFDFNGKYYQADCVPLTNFSSFEDKEEYSCKIEQIINHLLKKIQIEQNDIRFIFHLTKSPSNHYEIKAINNVLKNFKVYDVQYAFIKIGYYHNFRFFKNQGQQNPYSGQYLRIGSNEALVQFGEKDKMPVRFTLHKESKFKDLYSLSKQIYWFSHLSYRSFKPARKPVTTLYPWLITSLLEKMKDVPDWDKSVVRKMESKLWFI